MHKNSSNAESTGTDSTKKKKIQLKTVNHSDSQESSQSTQQQTVNANEQIIRKTNETRHLASSKKESLESIKIYRLNKQNESNRQAEVVTDSDVATKTTQKSKTNCETTSHQQHATSSSKIPPTNKKTPYEVLFEQNQQLACELEKYRQFCILKDEKMRDLNASLFEAEEKLNSVREYSLRLEENLTNQNQIYEQLCEKYSSLKQQYDVLKKTAVTTTPLNTKKKKLQEDEALMTAAKKNVKKFIQIYTKIVQNSMHELHQLVENDESLMSVNVQTPAPALVADESFNNFVDNQRSKSLSGSLHSHSTVSNDLTPTATMSAEVFKAIKQNTASCFFNEKEDDDADDDDIEEEEDDDDVEEDDDDVEEDDDDVEEEDSDDDEDQEEDEEEVEAENESSEVVIGSDMQQEETAEVENNDNLLRTILEVSNEVSSAQIEVEEDDDDDDDDDDEGEFEEKQEDITNSSQENVENKIDETIENTMNEAQANEVAVANSQKVPKRKSVSFAEFMLNRKGPAVEEKVNDEKKKEEVSVITGINRKKNKEGDMAHQDSINNVESVPKSILKIVTPKLNTPSTEESSNEEQLQVAKANSKSRKKSTDNVNNVGVEKDRRRSKVFSSVESVSLIEENSETVNNESAECVTSVLQEENLPTTSSEVVEPKSVFKSIFKSKQSKSQDIVKKPSKSAVNQKDNNFEAISSYLELEEDIEQSIPKKKGRKPLKAKVKEATVSNESKVPSVSTLTKPSKKNEEEKIIEKEVKSITIVSKKSKDTSEKKTNEVDDTSINNSNGNKMKRSIETIYENQELNISESQIQLPDHLSSECSTTLETSEQDPGIYKKIKLSGESNKENRQDSPPPPRSNNEISSSRRLKKNVSYKEVPLNAKMRRDKSNRIYLASNSLE